MSKCSVDIRKDIIDEISEILVDKGAFVEDGFGYFRNPRKSTSVINEINRQYKTMIIQEGEKGSFAIVPPASLVDAYVDRYNKMMEEEAAALQREEKLRGGYTEEQRGEFFQTKKATEQAPDKNINQKVKNFLAAIGVSVETTKQLRDRNGNVIEGIALADMLDKVIKVVEGQADITTLPEEASHFFVEMLGDGNPLLQSMLDKVTSYQLYPDVVQEYKGLPQYRNADGSINFYKIKKEAIGKLIGQHIIQQDNGSETGKKLGELNTWWQKLWNFIKSIFNSAPKRDGVIDNPFAQAAQQIVRGDTTGLDVGMESTEEYLQTATSLSERNFKALKEFQLRLTMDDSVDPTTKQKKHVYKLDGEELRNPDGKAKSVNENVVKPWYKAKFPTDRRTDVKRVIDDLKAEIGTELHIAIDQVINKYIDPDTGLRRPRVLPLDNPKLNPTVTTKIDNYIRALLSTYDENARFLTEVKVYNPRKKLPGTVDLVVLLPDGSADIYDWKSQEIFPGETELKWFKEPAYRLQLDEYKQALEAQFGILKFNKIRAIPIRTEFKSKKISQGTWVPESLKDIEIGPVDPSRIPENKEYLLPVVAQNESTGDEKLDKLIARLNSVYETLSTKSSKDKEKKAIELNKLKKTIRNLQVKKDMKYFVESGLLEIEKYNQKLIDNAFTIGEIMEAKDIISVYSEGSVYLKNILLGLKRDIQNEKDPDVRKSLEELQDDYKTMALNAQDLQVSLVETAKEMGDQVAQDYGIKGLLNPERVMDYMKRNFRALSQLETSSAQTFWKMLSKARQIRDVEIDNLNEELEKLRTDLSTWGSSRGLSGDRVFDGILETDENGKRTGDFISIYSKEYFEEKQKAIKRGDAAWIRDNSEFDQDAYTEAFKRYKDLVEGTRYSSDIKKDREKKDKAIALWVERHNGDKSEIAALLGKGNFLRPKAKWYSEKYQDLQKPDNAPLKAAYDYFQKLLRDSEKAGMIDYEFGFIPNILKTKLEQFALNDTTKVLSKRSLLQDLAIDSSTEFGKVDPIKGTQIREIPVYYTRDLGEDKSFDLFKVFSIWGTHTQNYKAMSSIEESANLILFVEQNKESLLTNRFGVVKKGAEPIKNNKVNSDILESFVNYYVYGEKLKSADDFAFKIGGVEVSASKTLQSVMRYFSIKTLALNPVSGTANLVGGTVNASFIAKKNLFFGDKDWAWSQGKFSSMDERAMAIIDYADPLLEDRNFFKSAQLSVSAAVRNMTSEKFFVIQRSGDKLVMYPTTIAMFRSHMVDENGKIVSIREYVKSKNDFNNLYNLPAADRKATEAKIKKEIEELSETSSLYAKSKVENDKLVIEGVDRKSEEFANFRNKIRKINKSILGNASSEDINNFRIGMLGQVMSQFRSWIPGLVTERFGDLAYDTDLETYNYGKARIFFKHFFDKKFFPLLTDLITGYGDNTIERAKSRYRELIVRKENQGDLNFKERMSEAQFIEMYIANLRSMTREMMILLAFLSLVLWAHGGGDDERKKSGFRKFLARAMDKYYNEVAFFYNPSEFQSLIKSPVPITGLFEDLYKFGTHLSSEVWGLGIGDEKITKESTPLKYFNRLVPIGKEFQSNYALFDDDFRKSMGIK